MSKHLGVTETMGLVDRLKTVVQEFTAREDKLNCDLRVRTASEQTRCNKGIEEVSSALAASIAESDASLNQATETANTKFTRRQAWIARAYKNSKKKALELIENKEGRRKHKLQMETMQATRARESGLAATEKTLVQFKEDLAAESHRLGAVEHSIRKAFGGYGKFIRMLSSVPEVDAGADHHQMLSQLREDLTRTEHELKQFRRRILPFLFRYTFLWVFLVLCQIPLVPVLAHFGKTQFTYQHAGASVAGFLVVGVILHLISKKQSEPRARSIAHLFTRARRLHDLAFERAEAHYTSEIARIENDFQTKTQWVTEQWHEAEQTAAASRETAPGRVEAKHTRAVAKNEQQHRTRLDVLRRDHDDRVASHQADANARKSELTTSCEEKVNRFNSDFETSARTLAAEWHAQITPLYDEVAALISSAARLFPPWSPEYCRNWAPPAAFEQVAKFGELEIDVSTLAGGIPKQLPLPGEARFALPLSLAYPNEGSVLFETTDAGRSIAIDALNDAVLRLLSVAPPGRLSFTVIDPVGLGQNFAGIMHLADYADHLINSRIWTQAGQIEEKLAELNEHMEKVIQMYLRNEYKTIAEYNEQAGNIAEKYHFLVVADFPTNFTDTAARRLLSIATSGARCGVYTLIHWNQSLPVPPDFIPEELRKSSVCISHKGQRFLLTGKFFPGTNLALETPPSADFATELIHKIGKSSRDSNRVEVPFEHVAPADKDLWTVDTTNELRVPIGRTGATKLQYLSIGKGTRQHALLAGKTGSGKSTLFHVIITNLALWSSPEEVEFYLIDFKKGVEFKCYATHRLPHARVVAIESDREFGLSVLQKLDDELRRRGDLYRKIGAQDVAGYKRAGGKEPMPRCLLMIDEFQEFFVEDDKISQTASVLLDRIVRQGRAFGIHVILGSQTLGGAYTMARTTIGQMVIRIALQCNEADAYLIMDENNPAPRLLSRPGEGIYNDAAGAVEGNSPFQAVWIADDVRDRYLEKIKTRAEQSGVGYPGPVVFEGNAPADIRENALLEDALRTTLSTRPVSPRIWLGAPNSIKGPTEAAFHRQSGNNLLIVGQSEEAILSSIAVALVALAAQFPRDTVRFVLFDGSAPGSTQREYLDRVVAAIPHNITVAKNNDLPEIMNGLAAELKERTENDRPDAPTTFLLIHGLHKWGKLRYEDDFSFSSDDTAANPGSQLNKIITEGASLGLHVIASIDTYNNVNRCLSKKALSEFEKRVLFQMSANDSASLIDNPKAGSLGLNRALFYNEQEGYLEIFRPYALPGNDWIEHAAQSLKS